MDESKVLGQNFITVVHDKNMPHVQLEIGLPMFFGDRIGGRLIGNKQDNAQIYASLNSEVLDRKVSFLIFSESLVHLHVLLITDVSRITHPEWKILVELFIRV